MKGIDIIKKVRIVVLLTIFLSSTSCEILNSYIVEPEENGFKTREEVINTVKNNIDILNELLNDINKMEIDKEYFTIEKDKARKMYKDSLVLDFDYINDLFEKIKIKVINIDKSDKTITFSVNFYTFSNNCGFYYSYDDNANYDNKDWKDEFPFIHKDDWTLLFGSRYGWYTEKICDNWFYYENYDGPRKVIRYIEDDLKDMGYYDRIIKEIEEYEQKRDGYKK